MMNYMQILQMIRSGQNPQQVMLQWLQQSAPNTPLEQNLVAMIQKGDAAGIENLARNMCESRGVDFDKEFKAFKQNIGFK